MKYEKYLTEKEEVSIQGWFLDLQVDDAKIDKVVNYVKSKDKKLAKEIDKFYNDYYKKLNSLEVKVQNLK